MNNRVGNTTELTFYRDPGFPIWVDDGDGEGNPSLFVASPANVGDGGAIGSGTGDYITWVNFNTLVVVPT